MPIRAGRVGVNPTDVDVNGHIKGTSDSYSKAQIDAKLSKKLNSEKVGGLEFREENGVAQYKLPSGVEWTNFSSGGATPTLLWTNAGFTVTEHSGASGYFDCTGNGNAEAITLDIDIDSYEYYIFLACRVSGSSLIKFYNVLSAETLKNCNDNSRVQNCSWVADYTGSLKVVQNKLVIPKTETASGFLGVYKVWGCNGLGLDEMIF